MSKWLLLLPLVVVGWPIRGADCQTISSPPPPIQEYTERLLKTCGYKGSEAKRHILISQLKAVVEDTYKERYQQEAFLMLVCIESRFDNQMKSKAGAVGYTQLMPKYAVGIAKECGLGKLEVKDIWDGEVNLRLGACYFNQLLVQFDGNVALALSGYNSGPDSRTTRQLGQLSEVGAQQETLGYISKFMVLKEKMK